MVEIQQSSDATFRLADWNRVGPDGQCRPLHVEQAFEVIDFGLGPLSPIRPQPTGRPEAVRLIECDKFVWDRWEIDARSVSVATTASTFWRSWRGPCLSRAIRRAAAFCAAEPRYLPAAAGAVRLAPQGKTILLDAYLP